MIDASAIAAAMKIPCLVSGDMQEKMQMWEDAYRNQSAWIKDRVRSMQTPSAIARELKRLMLTEFSLSVNDTELDTVMQKMIPKLRRKLDYGIASGGLLLKPYYTTNGLFVDMMPQTQYLPVNYTDDSCDAVACAESFVMGTAYYTRIELHQYNRATQAHTIQNRCFQSTAGNFLGRECSLKEVPHWANIKPEQSFQNVQQPLFAIFQMPDANNIDPDSPLGVSAFADALDFIKDADEHWERILWELESSERAIEASEDLFQINPFTQKHTLPKGRERMYHLLEKTGATDDHIYTVFSPEVRDSSYFNALNQMLRRIENAVGLSYGTLSEVSNVEKTAEEVLSSKQRSYTRVSDLQKGLQTALEQLLYGMQYYRNVYGFSGYPEATLSCNFGDGVLENSNEEFTRQLAMVQAGVLKPEYLLQYHFQCSEEEARKRMPEKGKPDDYSLYGMGGAS